MLRKASPSKSLWCTRNTNRAFMEPWTLMQKRISSSPLCACLSTQGQETEETMICSEKPVSRHEQSSVLRLTAARLFTQPQPPLELKRLWRDLYLAINLGNKGTEAVNIVIFEVTCLLGFTQWATYWDFHIKHRAKKVTSHSTFQNTRTALLSLLYHILPTSVEPLH